MCYDIVHRENLKSIFKDLGYTFIDFGQVLVQDLSNKGYKNRMGIITDCVKQVKLHLICMYSLLNLASGTLVPQ